MGGKAIVNNDLQAGALQQLAGRLSAATPQFPWNRQNAFPRDTNDSNLRIGDLRTARFPSTDDEFRLSLRQKLNIETCPLQYVIYCKSL